MAFVVSSNNERTHVFVKNDELLVLDVDSISCNEKTTKVILKCDIPANSNSTIFKEVSDKRSEKAVAIPVKVLSTAVSDNGNSLVACDSRNLIHLWTREQNDWKYLSTGRSVRKCQKVIFTHSNTDIILADRGGDVFVFSAQDTSKEGKFILGHISFITDICISPNDKILASCDRDGKIRISSYPNCYNIQSYCLGHTQFVSSLIFKSFIDQDILITSSGDGYMKLWDFQNGYEIVCKHMSENQSLSGDDCESVSNEISAEDSQLNDIFVKEPALKFSIQSIKICSKRNIISIFYHFLKQVSIFKMSKNNLEFVQVLNFPAQILDVAFIEDVLLVLLKSSSKILSFWFEYDECSTSYVQSKDIPSDISEVETFFSKNTIVDSQFNQLMLFKKLFDDTEEYDCKTKKNKIV